jgi:Bacterial PH domain
VAGRGEADEATKGSLPQVWRIPPWQAAALLLLTTALAAIDIYARPSAIPAFAVAFVAVSALVAAVCAIRYLLVADEDGLWVRRVASETLVAWPDVERVELTTAHRSGMTVRITRHDGSYVDVPPSLLLPTVPTTIVKTRSRIHTVATRLNALAAAQQKKT